MDQHSDIKLPIELIQTSITWNDLVIDNDREGQFDELKVWLKNHKDGTNDCIKKNYCVLFYGPPESRKTLAAGLLAKEAGKEAYKIDLSTVVSKYIGETEKNLEL